MYRNLTYLAMIGVPAAPVIFFGWRVYSATIEMTGYIWLAIPAALATAIGLEVVGIIAGHVGLENWRRGETGRAAISALILLAYVAIGVWELQGTIGAIAFLIAPLVYILAALYEALEAQTVQEGQDDERKRQQEEEDREFERKQKAADLEVARKQKAADKEAARQLKLKQQADRTAVELAKLEAGKRQDGGRVERQDTGNLPGDWRQLTHVQRHDLAHATREEREDMFPELAGRTRREWHSRLDKLAAQNGHV
jgi:hypothetical protein